MMPKAIDIYTKMIEALGDKVSVDNVSEDVNEKISTLTAVNIMKTMYSEEYVELVHSMVKDKPMRYSFRTLSEFKKNVEMSVVIELIKGAAEVINKCFSEVDGDVEKN